MSNIDNFRNIDDISNLEGTPFDIIPIEGEATPEDIESYKMDPIVMWKQRYSIRIDRNELDEVLIKAAGAQAEEMKAAILRNDPDAMRKILNVGFIFEKYQRDKFLELVDSNGMIPLENLKDVSFGKPILYKVSHIHYIRNDGSRTLPPGIIVNSPKVHLKGVWDDASSHIPARYLPMMFPDEAGFVNQLIVAGRLADFVRGEE